MAHVPTVQEELYRKALEQLERLEKGRRIGRLTEAQYATGVDTLWNTCSGLLPADFMALIELAQVDQTDASFRRLRFFQRPGDYCCLVAQNPADWSVSLWSNLGGMRTPYVPLDEANPVQASQDRFNHVVEGLKDRGYTEFSF